MFLWYILEDFEIYIIFLTNVYSIFAFDMDSQEFLHYVKARMQDYFFVSLKSSYIRIQRERV